MADPITIHGGINIGTDGNDDLGTLEWRRNVEEQRDETTIYPEGIRALDGDDTLNNNGNFSNVSLDGGAGNDRIINSNTGGENVLFLGGDGNDYIENGSSDNRQNNPIIDGGAGSDTVSNYGDNALINLGDGNDSLYNVGDKATISAGAGADNVSHFGDDSSIDAGAGDDTVGGYGNNVTVRGGAGNDSITTYGNNDGINSKILLDDTQGNNHFQIGYTTNGTIQAGSGNDTVDSGTNEKLLINAGAGNNSIVSQYGNGVTINAAGGSDTITIYDGKNFVVDAGDGANVIENSRVNDTTASGHTITSGSGNDSITNRVNNALITAGNGNNTVVNGAYGSGGGSNVTINTGSGNDFINNYYDSEHASGAKQENVLINSGAGNDTVTNITDKVTIDGGAGNDELSSYDSTDVSINGGAGADTIFIANGTVSGGAGDDSLSVGENVLIRYTAGDGNDAIWSFDANSTLSIGGGNYSSAVSGSDVVLTVGNGKITLSEAATLDNLNIVGDTTAGDTTAGDTTLADTVKAAVVADMILHRTEAGYPVIAGLAFHPEEYHGDEPTNYAAKENWSITSKDGLELNGIHYTPENSNDKWVIIIHGYGHNHKHMYPFAGFYLANGYNVLMVDQRAAGDSEGEWLTMGAAESQDIALWTQEIARRNSDAKITLFGVSMGSATAMLAASRSDIKNVTSLVEDCGYTNMMDVVRLLHSNIPAMQSLLSAQDLPVLDTVASVFTGYNLSDAAPLDSISNAKMPSLFITGTEDAVVPVSALTALYDASGADVKEQFIVQGATHGVAGLYDPVGYSNTTFRFLAEANGEGWVTENITDDILLRGTKYGDSIGNSGDNVTIDTYAGNDSITSSGEKVLIYGDEGNDSIYASGANTTIDGGAGSNYISVTGSQGLYVVFDGNTTVQGFNTGFGDGSDTVYIPGTPAGVDFKSGVLTFYNDNENAALIMQGITSTAKVNLYHESRNVLNKGVFISDNDWYRVESSDLSVKSGEEVYFVGPSATNHHGVDFSGIASALNLTLDTAYIDSEDYVPGTTTWINGVYSIRGGAGLTTITGSKLSDTIIAGTGRTTINARGGNDYISLTSARALVNYASGDGNDTIQGFNTNSTLNISGEKYSSVASGNDLVLSVGSDKITLKDAATLDNLNIIGNAGNTGLEIDNSADHTIVTGTANNDSIINTGRRVTVRGLAGDDYLVNIIDSSVTAESAVANLFEGGDGNDTIYSYHSYHPTLLGGNGNDRIIVNKGHMNYIDGGAGNDSILGRTTDTLDSSDWAMGGYATLLGGDGNDYIDPFYTNNSTIDGGAGNDTINMMGADSTITGGKGDDRISLGTVDSVNVRINYNSGDGNDVITGFTENDTLNISGAKYFSIKSGNDMILSVGDGRLTLNGAANLETVNILGSYDEAADSIISNSSNRVSVAGTSANDTIVNAGRFDTIQGLAGNDSIVNSGANGFIYGDVGNDTITNSGSSVLISGGADNDSIFSSGSNATINGGAGSNYVSLSGSNASFVVLEGKTTVDGFTTGFGSGADSVYITGDPAVDFRSGGLTFYEENGDSLTLHNVSDTAKVYLYYETKNRTRKGIFIAQNDMYTVTDSDLSLGTNEDVYFVGTSATNNHGVDFSNISQAINVTMNTDYEAAPQFWVNNVHSIIGGAGRTQITGSDEDDTIIAGTGATTINASGGNDHISLTSAQARVNYEAGDGNDLIQGFNANSTLDVAGTYSSVVSGDDVILTVGNNKLTLQGAADLEELNILGTLTGSAETYTGGDATIASYSGQPVTFAADYQGAAFAGDNFVVYSSTGALTIENVTDKVVDLRDASGKEALKAYEASTAGLIDGRGLAGYQIIAGSAGSDVIFAGDEGSMLWGGNDTVSDAIAGGNGADTFICGRYQGSDNFYNVSSADAINLLDVSLSDIVGTFEADGTIAIAFNTGNAITAQSTDSLSAAINLADGSSWRFNHSTKAWQNA